MPRARATPSISWAPRPPVDFRVGPVTRIIDSQTPDATTAGVIARAGNSVVVQADVGPLVQGRPGLSFTGAGGTPQMGSAGARTVQLLTTWTTLAGTSYTVAMVGGKFYTYTWSTDAWAEAVNAAAFAAATGGAVTLSTTTKCYGAVLNNTLIVSDGANVGFSWDGTTNGGVVKLTSAPVFYGPLVVYYGKLFGIKSTERNTVVWSEEAAPNTGYEAGGYNNAWSLWQSDQDQLTGLAATNSQLVIFRQTSTTAITGAVTDAFSSTGTRDALSETVGSASPDGIQVWDGMVYFLGSDRHLYRITSTGLQEVGKGHRRALGTIPIASLASAQLVPWYGAPNQRYLLCGFQETSASGVSKYLVLDADTGEAAGDFTGWTCQRSGIVQNAGGQLFTAFGAGSTPTALDGYVSYLNTLDGSVWIDGLQAASQPIAHEVLSGFLGWDESVDKLWDRADLSFTMPTDLSLMTLGYVTSRGTATPQTLPTIEGVAGSRWDSFLWDTGTWADASAIERKVSVGWNGQGRWLQAVLRHDTASEQFQFQSARIYAIPLDVNPKAA
jgi:hypothetical protein